MTDPGIEDKVPEESAEMRLQRFLARAGVASRRKCERLITEGRIAVNGRIVAELGTKVAPGRDVVEFDGSRVELPQDGSHVVIMLNKPKGYVTSMEAVQSQNDLPVSDLIPLDEFPSLFYVGRLDRDTTGLLLFTDDGDLGNALTHPSRGVTKRYLAHIEGELGQEDRAVLENGIQLDDGMTSPAVCEVLNVRADGTSDVALSIHEGRKRQVRRMFSAIGHEVIDLERTDFGPLSIGGLPYGSWRMLDDGERARLYAACGLQYV